MSWPCSHRLPRAIAVTAAAALVGIWQTSAFASQNTPACAGPSMEADDVVDPSWIQAIKSVQARLRHADDLDRCAELHLNRSGDAMRVRVATADGRTATRYVQSPNNLLATIEALLELPA